MSASITVHEPDSSSQRTLRSARSRPLSQRFSTISSTLTLSTIRASVFASSTFSSGSKPKKKIGLVDLHADVLLLIFSYLRWPGDLCTLARTSHALNKAVTPALYKTIVVVPCPRATLALLARLERDDALCAAVRTLVFDDRARPPQPNIPGLADFARSAPEDLSDVPRSWKRSSKKDGWGAGGGRSGGDYLGDPHRVRLRLHHVLPKLRGLQRVLIKRWTHTLLGPLSASECYHYWSPHGYGDAHMHGATGLGVIPNAHGNRRGLRKMSRIQRILRAFTFTAPYAGPPAVMHGDRQPCPLDIVSLLLLRCPDLNSLSVVGVFPAMRFSHPPTAFGRLTQIVVGEQTAGAGTWNAVLRQCKELRALGLLNVHFRFEKLLAGCYFPHLESIEWYAYAFTASLTSRKPAKAFADFIQKHSATLKCISLAPRQYHPLRGLPYDGGLPFFDPDNSFLPKLETLRLSNWSIFVSVHDRWPHTESSQFRACAEMICRFVEARPSLTDLTLTDFPPDLAEHLRDCILAKRPMRRLLVGESLIASRMTCVPSESPYVPPQRGWAPPGTWVRARQAEWAATRRREYLLEAWQSYGVMFEGLALAESGYRPCLLDAKFPRSWMDYLRVHHSL